MAAENPIDILMRENNDIKNEVSILLSKMQEEDKNTLLKYISELNKIDNDISILFKEISVGQGESDNKFSQEYKNLMEFQINMIKFYLNKLISIYPECEEHINKLINLYNSKFKLLDEMTNFKPTTNRTLITNITNTFNLIQNLNIDNIDKIQFREIIDTEYNKLNDINKSNYDFIKASQEIINKIKNIKKNIDYINNEISTDLDKEDIINLINIINDTKKLLIKVDTSNKKDTLLKLKNTGSKSLAGLKSVFNNYVGDIGKDLNNKLETLKTKNIELEKQELEREEIEEKAKELQAEAIDIEDTDIISKAETDKNFTNKLEQLSKDIVEFKAGLNDIIGKNVSIEQTGGVSNSISNLYSLYKIFNTDLMIKIIVLLNNNSFDNFIKKMNIKNRDNFLKLFFVRINQIQLSAQVSQNDKNDFNAKATRDTNIINSILKSSNNKYIFSYTLTYELNKHNNLISNNQETIIKILLKKIIVIYNIYDKLYKKYDIINELYNEYIRENKRVYSYVKIRQDKINGVTEINPRYNYVIDDVHKYLNIAYYNFNEKIGIDEKGKYTNNRAKSDILKQMNTKEIYYLGKFDNIFNQTKENNIIARECEILVDKLIGGESVCVIGYGQSGSGKTSTLIYLKTKDTTQDGVLIELCKLNKFTSNFNKISVQMKNIFLTYNDESNVNNFNDYKIDNINFGNSIIETFTLSEGIFKNGSQNLGDFINENMTKRQVEPTPNNPDSSRSHVIICLTIYPIETNKKPVHLFICDLAGVENEFMCDNLDEITNFDAKYRVSKEYLKENPTFDKYSCPRLHKQAENIFNEVNTYYKEHQEFINKYNNIINYIDEYHKIDNNDRKIAIKQVVNNYFSDDFKGGAVDKKPVKTLTKKEKTIKISPNEDTYNYNYIISFIEKDEYIYDDKLETIKIILNDSEMSKRSVDDLTMAKTYINNIIKDNGKELINFIDNYFIVKPAGVAKRFFKGNEYIDEIRSTDYLNTITQLINSAKKRAKQSNILKTLINTDIKTNLIPNLIIKWLDIGDISGTDIDKKIKAIFINDVIKKYNEYLGKINIAIEEAEKREEQNKQNKVIQEEINKINDELKSKKIEISKEIEICNDTSYNVNKVIFDTITSDKYIKAKANFLNNIKDIKTNTELNTELNKLELLNKQYIQYKMYQFNCILRRNEGYMINHSLRQMRNDIKHLTKEYLSKNASSPLFFEPEIYPYCRNINYEQNYYEDFYPKSLNTIHKYGEIIKTLQSFGDIDLSKIIFVVFTVVNFTNDGKVNNPPNPPYINISEITYNLNINKLYKIDNSQKIIELMNILINKLENYNYYNKEINYQEKLNSYRNNDYNIELIELLLDIIKNTNASTLIGSLESTLILQNLSYDKFICSYREQKAEPPIWENIAKVNNTFTEKTIEEYNKNNFKYEQTTSIQKDLIKYLKYKKKYLELKNSLKN